MPDEVELAQVVREITVIEARLIAARHLKLTDRIRLLESEKRRLEARLAQLETRVVTSVKVVEIGVEFEVAIGQAAMGGSLPISVSSRGGVSSAIASICM